MEERVYKSQLANGHVTVHHASQENVVNKLCQCVKMIVVIIMVFASKWEIVTSSVCAKEVLKVLYLTF